MQRSTTFSSVLFLGLVSVACSSSDATPSDGSSAAPDGGIDSLNDGGTPPTDNPDADSGPASDGGALDGGALDSGGPDGALPSAFPYGPYGSYKPSSTTSGVRAGTTLIPYTNQFGAIVNGVLTLSTAGVTIAGYDIQAFIVVKADKIMIKNSRIRGPATLPASGSYNLISAYAPAATNLLVQDCTIVPDVPNHDSQGIQGKSFLAERNNIYNSVDGIDPLGEATILANYIHDLSWYAPDTNHADNHSHNDCIQFEGGSATVEYNNLQGFLSKTVGDGPARPYDQANSVMLAVANTSPLTTNLVISGNWIDGGQVSINVGAGSYTTLGSIDKNIFGDNMVYAIDAILLNSPRASIGLTITNNHFGAVDLPLKNPLLSGTVVDTGNGVQGG